MASSHRHFWNLPWDSSIASLQPIPHTALRLFPQHRCDHIICLLKIIHQHEAPNLCGPSRLGTSPTSPALYQSIAPAPPSISQPQRIIPRTHPPLYTPCLHIGFVFCPFPARFLFSLRLRSSTISSVVPWALSEQVSDGSLKLSHCLHLAH